MFVFRPRILAGRTGTFGHIGSFHTEDVARFDERGMSVSQLNDLIRQARAYYDKAVKKFGKRSAAMFSHEITIEQAVPLNECILVWSYDPLQAARLRQAMAERGACVPVMGGGRRLSTVRRILETARTLVV